MIARVLREAGELFVRERRGAELHLVQAPKVLHGLDGGDPALLRGGDGGTVGDGVLAALGPSEHQERIQREERRGRDPDHETRGASME